MCYVISTFVSTALTCMSVHKCVSITTSPPLPSPSLPSPPLPQAMTEAERAPYTHRAKVEKKGTSGVVREGRMDNQGELLSVRHTRTHTHTCLTVNSHIRTS